jgi:hypothetical protein
MISECINFIRQSILNFPEKKQLRLALAVLELKRGSKEKGLIALEELIADPPLSPELQGFVSEAKRLLAKNKSNNNKNIY